MGNQVAVRDESRPSMAVSVFDNAESFDQAQRMCKALIHSTMVPKEYRLTNDNPDAMSNALVALDMSRRMSMPPMMVMQNLHMIEGRPSWRSEFIIGALNSCGLFDPIEFEEADLGEQEVSYETWGEQRGTRVTKKVKLQIKSVRATAISRRTGNLLRGPEVTTAMAVAEGWYFRKGSKWPTMEDLMIRYRSAAFFGRLYAPHILNGFPTADEAPDIETDYVVNAPGEEPTPTRGKSKSRMQAAIDRAAKDKAGETGKAEEKPKAEPAKAKAAEEKAAKPKADEGKAATSDEVQDAEFEEVGNPPADGAADEIPFGDPGDDDDDDYQPA